MAWNMVTQYCNTNDFGSVAWFKFPMSKTFSKDTARYHREAAVFRQCYVHNGFSHLWTRSKRGKVKWIIEPLRNPPKMHWFLEQLFVEKSKKTGTSFSSSDIKSNRIHRNTWCKIGLVRVKADYHRSTSQPRKFHGRFTVSLSIIDSQGLIHVFYIIQWSKDVFWH